MEISNLDNKLLKIGVFYDGGYFAKVSQYYRYYDERRARISFKGLHDFIREKVKDFEKAPDKNFVQIVDAHYFRGRFSAYDAAARGKEQLFNDRLFDDALMYANVVTHYLPMFKNRHTTSVTEKGVDVWFALEAFELAVLKRFSVVVLITGDGDHLPLIRKLNTIGARVLLLWWDIDFPATSNESAIRTNPSIINEATYDLNMFDVFKSTSKKQSPLIDNIFIETTEDDKFIKQTTSFKETITVSEIPKTEITPKAETHTPPKVETKTIQPTATGKLKGKVMFIDKERGIGNIVGIDKPEHQMLVFFRDFNTPGDFDEIEKYDTVEYEIGHNAKGELARKVKCVD
jgi:uncharacterized LabA/DUF88 family protein